MDWMQLGAAVLLAGMLVMFLPRALHMMKNSPKGSAEDWKSAILPILAVVGFVLLLIASV